MRRMFAVLALVASGASAIAIVAACTSFSDGDDEPITPGGDASAVDALPGIDGGAVDSGAGCKRVLDEGMTAKPAEWVDNVQDGGTLFVQSDAGASMLGALGATVTPTSVYGQARIEIDRLPLPKAAHLSYAVQIVAAGSPSLQFAEVGCRLQLRAADETYVELGSHIGSDDFEVDDQVNGGTDPGEGVVVGPLALRHWYRVTVSFANISPTSAKATLAVDGMALLTREVKPVAAPERIRVKCGIDYADPGVSASVLVDDVTLDFCDE
jgi:hypothetical protein